MTKFGQVSAFDASTGMATIVYARPDACEKCGACGTKTHQGSISLKADCVQGDWVRVELPDGQFLKATSIAYLVPLCGFVLGLMLGYFLSGKNELIAFLGAMGGLALSLVPLMLADDSRKTVSLRSGRSGRPA